MCLLAYRFFPYNYSIEDGRQNDDNIKNNTRQCVEQLLVHTYWLHRGNTAGHLLPCYLKMYILSTISEHQNHITAHKCAKL